MKKTILIALVLGGVTLLGLGVWFFLNTRGPRPVYDEKVVLDITHCVSISDIEERKVCETLGFGAWIDDIRDRSIAEKNSELCNYLSEIERDSCFFSYHSLVFDSSVCEKIEDESIRSQCQSMDIVQGGDFGACQTISDEEDRNLCFEILVSRHEVEGEAYCDTVGSNASDICREVYFTRQAIIHEDSMLCSRISILEGRTRCLTKLPLDTDGDGLSDSAERLRYNTDPGRADTDGDGFSDGTEVRSNNNPLGR